MQSSKRSDFVPGPVPILDHLRIKLQEKSSELRALSAGSESILCRAIAALERTDVLFRYDAEALTGRFLAVTQLVCDILVSNDADGLAPLVDNLVRLTADFESVVDDGLRRATTRA